MVAEPGSCELSIITAVPQSFVLVPLSFGNFINEVNDFRRPTKEQKTFKMKIAICEGMQAFTNLTGFSKLEKWSEFNRNSTKRMQSTLPRKEKKTCSYKTSPSS